MFIVVFPNHTLIGKISSISRFEITGICIRAGFFFGGVGINTGISKPFRKIGALKLDGVSKIDCKEGRGRISTPSFFDHHKPCTQVYNFYHFSVEMKNGV